MPELPEVETVRCGLEPVLAGAEHGHALDTITHWSRPFLGEGFPSRGRRGAEFREQMIAAVRTREARDPSPDRLEPRGERRPASIDGGLVEGG